MSTGTERGEMQRSGAVAVIGRPIKPFGLLTNLAIARNIWCQTQDLARDARRYKRKVMGEQVVVRAKTILMSEEKLDEDRAHRELRARAMQRRIAIEAMASEIVSAYEAGLARAMVRPRANLVVPVNALVQVVPVVRQLDVARREVLALFPSRSPSKGDAERPPPCSAVLEIA